MQKKNAQPLSEVLSAFFDSNKTLKKQFAAHLQRRGGRNCLGRRADTRRNLGRGFCMYS